MSSEKKTQRPDDLVPRKDNPTDHMINTGGSVTARIAEIMSTVSGHAATTLGIVAGGVTGAAANFVGGLGTGWSKTRRRKHT